MDKFVGQAVKLGILGGWRGGLFCALKRILTLRDFLFEYFNFFLNIWNMYEVSICNFSENKHNMNKLKT